LSKLLGEGAIGASEFGSRDASLLLMTANTSGAALFEARGFGHVLADNGHTMFYGEEHVDELFASGEFTGELSGLSEVLRPV
jgi:hypothetical protein